MPRCFLIITSSIQSNYQGNSMDKRVELYKKAIGNTLTLIPQSIIPIIVENNGKRETFLDLFPCTVIYTNNNQKKGFHKGVNELNDIKQVINECKIKDDDMIIKLTGRYFPLTNNFFQLVLSNIDRKDALVKFFNVSSRKFEKYDSILGFFALRCKYLKTFTYNGVKSAEQEFSHHLHNTIDDYRIHSVRNLSIECCFAISNEVLLL